MKSLDITYGDFRVRYSVDAELNDKFDDRTVYEYWVELTDGSIIREFGSSRNAKRDARIFARLAFHTKSHRFPETDEVVPVEIAAQGKASVAAYLRIVQGMELERVAQLLEVTESTIRQYLSDFANLRR